jgi:hypothetical protein
VRLRFELAVWREADAELAALQTLATRIQDLLLGSTNGPSSLAVSMSVVAELLEGQIDTATADGVRWVSHSALVATMSHFPEL